MFSVYLPDALHLDVLSINALRVQFDRKVERVVGGMHLHPVQQQTMLILLKQNKKYNKISFFLNEKYIQF